MIGAVVTGGFGSFSVAAFVVTAGFGGYAQPVGLGTISAPSIIIATPHRGLINATPRRAAIMANPKRTVRQI
jgi:hypothetical protein